MRRFCDAKKMKIYRILEKMWGGNGIEGRRLRIWGKRGTDIMSCTDIPLLPELGASCGQSGVQTFRSCRS